MKQMSKVEVAHATLKEELLSGRLPQGTPLRIEMLQENFGHGATPLREALARLEAEGFVEQQQHRGFFATRITPADFEDLHYTRSVLEQALVLRAIEKGDDAWEGRVVAAHHFLSRTQIDLSAPDTRLDLWQERHVEFHLALASGSGAHRLLNDYRRAFEHIRRHQMALSHLSSVSPRLPESDRSRAEIAELERRMAIGEHTRLMEAVLNRDVERTKLLLAGHLALMPLKLTAEKP